VQPTDLRSLAQAYPAASSTVVFFAHGLMESEVAWAIGGLPTYGARLTADLGFSEVQVRYNTGKHISENGREFAALIGDVVANWPVPVENIAVVGHSMGGLVARSACHGASEAGHPWTRLVRHIVCLGSPHLGAPLARTVHTTTALLHLFPESRPFGGLLRRRSAGIRDLYAGSLVDEDWSDRDLDALRQAAIAEVPLLADADHSFVSASITRDPDHLLGRHLGDGLVMHVSARGRDKLRDIGFNDADGMHLGSAHHFTLLNNDAVYDWLADRLRGR
jgi:pimeloyl-ACP methyl ester carboxylesterase